MLSKNKNLPHRNVSYAADFIYFANKIALA